MSTKLDPLTLVQGQLIHFDTGKGTQLVGEVMDNDNGVITLVVNWNTWIVDGDNILGLATPDEAAVCWANHPLGR